MFMLNTTLSVGKYLNHMQLDKCDNTNVCLCALISPVKTEFDVVCSCYNVRLEK